MPKPIVEIKVTKDHEKVYYNINCSNEVTSEELAHYLDEIIEGICTWKPGVCEETIKTIKGTLLDNK